ncbi:MAG: family 43 glycosylhydrolase, partial [Kiritimatiellia bacterium]
MFGMLLLAATFANPVLPADFSDLDCIRHEGRYYAITSTLHLSPGMDVLASDDMVDWQVTGHVVDDTSVFG